MNIQAASAANRFGLGARPGELQRIGSEPRDWLHQQLAKAPPMAAGMPALPDSFEYLKRYYAVRKTIGQIRIMRKKAAKTGAKPPAKRVVLNGSGAALQQLKRQDLQWRQQTAFSTEHGFAERIVRFWSNHFAISIDKGIASLFGPPMEREAIRPHAMGNFADLLLAVERHPGMLLYLDNVKSVGEESRLAQNAARRAKPGTPAKRKPGINENLAREILELHTLGVDGGYAQGDVTELARAITGWGVPRRGKIGDSGQAFSFHPEAHQPGARLVLGRSYRDDDEAQGAAILRDLAVHPATARHLAFKLARHFVADQPPTVLVERMAEAYLASHGELVPMYRSMVDHDAAWGSGACKFKTPDDFMVSALRACGFGRAGDVTSALDMQARLGQPIFKPRSPAGFADVAASWDGPDALFKRVQAAQSIAERMPGQHIDPLEMGESALGASLRSETATALRRAESARQGVALLLASPDFQWRA